MYYGSFNSRADVCEQFGIEEFDGLVIYANYHQEEYEGSADVIFSHDGKLFHVQGAHCSCYGMDGQWEPEETTVEVLLHMYRKGHGQLSDDRLAYAVEALAPAIASNNLDEIAMLARLLS